MALAVMGLVRGGGSLPELEDEVGLWEKELVWMVLGNHGSLVGSSGDFFIISSKKFMVREVRVASSSVGSHRLAS